MLAILFPLLFICAVGALFWWALNRLSIPEPAKTFALLIVALVVLVAVVKYLPGAPNLGL